MIRVDGFYLYSLGHSLHVIQEIQVLPNAWRARQNKKQCFVYLYGAEQALDDFLNRSIFKLRNLQRAAAEFKAILDAALAHCSEQDRGDDFPSDAIIFDLQESHRSFEAVLRSELGGADLYMVQRKSAFDTLMLTESGHSAFPEATWTKVPETIFDLDQAMKCIAFELPTAASFHLYRALETVLGHYWTAVSGGQDRPKSQALGSYINELEKLHNHDDKVVSALRDIKNLHRNPNVHGDSNVDSSEDAIDLYGAIRAVMSVMTKSIPERTSH